MIPPFELIRSAADPAASARSDQSASSFFKWEDEWRVVCGPKYSATASGPDIADFSRYKIHKALRASFNISMAECRAAPSKSRFRI